MSGHFAAITLQQFAFDLGSAVDRQDGPTLASVLDLQDDLAVQRLYAGLPYLAARDQQDLPYLSTFKQTFKNLQLDSSCQAAWCTIASKHVLAIIHLSSLPTTSVTSSKAFEAQLDLAKAFVAWFQDSAQTSTVWALPALFGICRDLKQLAETADDALTTAGQRASKLEEAGRTVTKAWTACMNDRSSNLFGTPKRNLGTYYLATLLFKIYFRLQTLGLCKNIVRGIQNQTDLPPLSSFPRSHQVTYRFYLGVFAFLNERYQDAETELVFAHNNCHVGARKNQEQILAYLIPLRLLRGILPSSTLLNNYPSIGALYRPFITAYRIGDLQGYDNALLNYRAALIGRGTYLITERAREGCLRTLFKRVWLCSGHGSRLLVQTVQRALVHVGVDIDSDEVECLLANLIYKGHLKGYISHERQTVVLAKDKPFPTIIGRALAP